jgi:hypothetical protein
MNHRHVRREARRLLLPASRKAPRDLIDAPEADVVARIDVLGAWVSQSNYDACSRRL